MAPRGVLGEILFPVLGGGGYQGFGGFWCLVVGIGLGYCVGWGLAEAFPGRGLLWGVW